MIMTTMMRTKMMATMKLLSVIKFLSMFQNHVLFLVLHTTITSCIGSLMYTKQLVL